MQNYKQRSFQSIQIRFISKIPHDTKATKPRYACLVLVSMVFLMVVLALVGAHDLVEVILDRQRAEVTNVLNAKKR